MLKQRVQASSSSWIAATCLDLHAISSLIYVEFDSYYVCSLVANRDRVYYIEKVVQIEFFGNSSGLINCVGLNHDVIMHWHIKAR